jgi:hypothetical protein
MNSVSKRRLCEHSEAIRGRPVTTWLVLTKWMASLRSQKLVGGTQRDAARPGEVRFAAAFIPPGALFEVIRIALRASESDRLPGLQVHDTRNRRKRQIQLALSPSSSSRSLADCHRDALERPDQEIARFGLSAADSGSSWLDSPRFRPLKRGWAAYVVPIRLNFDKASAKKSVMRVLCAYYFPA